MNEPVDRPHLADETLSLHLDGELDPARARAVAEHLAACPRCSARSDALAAASAVLRATVVEPPSELDARRLLDRALERSGWPRRRTWGSRALAAPAIPALAAAVLAVLVAIGLLSYDRPSRDETASRAEVSPGGTSTLPADAFVGDLGDLGALTDPGSLDFLEQVGADEAASRSRFARDYGLAETTTTAAALTPDLLGEPGPTAPSVPDSELGSKRRGPTSDAPAGTALSREASPEEAADILQCAETIEASARQSSEADDSDSPRAPAWHLQLAATGELSGSPALLLAFQRESGGLQVFLVRRDDCSIVHFLTSPRNRP